MGPRIAIVRAATKETAEKIVNLLTAEKAYERLEIEPENWSDAPAKQF